MSEAVSALGAISTEGLATVTALPPQGMITIRGDLASDDFSRTVVQATELGIPGQREVVTGDSTALAWMSPDELLWMLPYSRAASSAVALTKSFGAQFALAVDVSDARAVFSVEGAGAREALAKLAPVDLDPKVFRPGEVRRTRMAQIPAAFWLSGPQAFTVICFRSVARYAFDILSLSVSHDGRVDHFR